MATETAPALTPLSEWDDEGIDAYVTPGRMAGSVAWNVLTHSQGSGPDIVRVIGPDGSRRPVPEGMESEDLWQFLFDLVEDAGQIGYVVAQIEMRGFALPWENAKLRTVDVARAVAALLRIEVCETDDPFASHVEPEPITA